MNYHCKILYQSINKYGYYKYFPISLDFRKKFPPPQKNQIFDLLIQLGIIAGHELRLCKISRINKKVND